MDARRMPQILAHITQGATCTIHDTVWVPCSAKFVLLGSTSRNNGAFQIYELENTEIKKLKDVVKADSFKCGTFGASSVEHRCLATGDYKGKLCTWDLEDLSLPVFHTKAHESIINAIDAIGGLGVGNGAPEIVTGGRDGRVLVWDPRQKDVPAASFEPASGGARDCWAVGFGNSYNDEERCILAGYDNGDLKLFDLRLNKIRWETTLPNGVCGVEFDRKDIKANKCVAVTLESKFHVFDLRTQHPDKGFAMMTETLKHGTTVWGVRHLPQNREIFMTLGGDGSLSLFKYSYPSQRWVKDGRDLKCGVAGTVELLSNKSFATQPISCFNWNTDKEGLAVCGSFDQNFRVMVVTKLEKF
ncbi:hypothetical protein Mapa_004109 [Marchantia paleacea]|nr:hypothetical protein Mapa_004109 [Marchantia paleacea]